MTLWSWSISTTRVPLANKLGWVMTSLYSLLPIMSHAALITWPCEIRGPLTRRGSSRKRLSLHRLLFLFPVSVFYWTGKRYFQIFVQLLLWARVAKIEVNNMVCRVFLTQVLWKLISNSGLKQEHLKFSSLATKNIIHLLPQCLCSPKLAGWWLTMRGSHPYNHMALWSRGLVRSRDKLNSL